jgi:hypothetical protein
MNKILIALFLAISFNAAAWEDTQLGDPYLSSKEGYKSRTGTEYQYDLSRPVDQIKYETDIKAQMRDENSINIKRDLDRDLGQVGGGIYK